MKKHPPGHPEGPQPPSGRKASSQFEQHGHHDHQSAIMDPPNHMAIPPPEVQHPALHRHAALKANALMANVMAQAKHGPPASALPPALRARLAKDESPVQPLLVLQPTVLNSVLIGPVDEEGIGIDVVDSGVTVRVEAWTSMGVGDQADLFWHTFPTSVTASKLITLPDEVNKPVLLDVPRDIVTAGLFSVVCRVTRGQSGIPDMSPARTVLVKLDPPGDISPPPPENTNLAAPILPTEVIDDGVDADRAASGVPVTILPYPNMAAGDRIRLSWGGSFVERTVVDGEVDHNVTLIVNDATIRGAGDSDALIVRYQVYDLVNNRSGLSPAIDVAVKVIGNALLPPQVIDADSDGVIDLARLGSADVRVFVTALAPDFVQGDVVTLNWLGHSLDGLDIPYTDTRTVTRTPPETLEFAIPNSLVAALAQGDAVLSYRLPNGRTSPQARVTVEGIVADALPPPTVDQAENGQLDPALASATVRIPAYGPLAPGYSVTLIWLGTRRDDQAIRYQITRSVTNSMVGKDILIPVPASEIAPLDGGFVEIWYEITADTGTRLPASRVLRLRVGSGAGLLLPAPTVDEAPDNATLNPDDVNIEATVRIQPYDDMAIGDRIDLYWVGSGGTFTDWTKVGSTGVGREVELFVEKEYVTANDGGTVTISYTVTKGSDVQSSSALTLRVGEVEEHPTPGTNPDITVTEADPLTQTLNLVKTYTNGIHVVIRYDNMAINDIVTMIWQGAPGTGSQEQAATVTRVAPLTFTVATTVLTPNYNSTVRIGYTVRRNGVPVGPTEPTLWFDLLIQKIDIQGAATYQKGTAIVRTCNPQQTSITIPEDLAIGAVILTTLGFRLSSNNTIIRSASIPPVNLATFVYNVYNPQPKDDSTIFATSLAGVGIEAVFDAGDGSEPNALMAGPWIYPKATFDDQGTLVRLRLVKTGPIKSGTISSSGFRLYWEFGSNFLIHAEIYLGSSVTINVLAANKRQAALPAAKT